MYKNHQRAQKIVQGVEKVKEAIKNTKKTETTKEAEKLITECLLQKEVIQPITLENEPTHKAKPDNVKTSVAIMEEKAKLSAGAVEEDVIDAITID